MTTRRSFVKEIGVAVASCTGVHLSNRDGLSFRERFIIETTREERGRRLLAVMALQDNIINGGSTFINKDRVRTFLKVHGLPALP